MSLWFLWLWVISDLAYIVVGYGMLGPADLFFQTLERCEDDGMGNIKLSVKQKKYNRTVNLLDISIQSPYDFDDNIILELKGSIKKEGGYKPGSFYMKDSACKTVGVLMGDIFTKLLKSSGTDECPLMAGEHSVMGFHFDNSEFTVPQVYGEYKMEANVFKDDELQACFNAYYVMVPKEG